MKSYFFPFVNVLILNCGFSSDFFCFYFCIKISHDHSLLSRHSFLDWLNVTDHISTHHLCSYENDGACYYTTFSYVVKIFIQQIHDFCSMILLAYLFTTVYIEAYKDTLNELQNMQCLSSVWLLFLFILLAMLGLTTTAPQYLHSTPVHRQAANGNSLAGFSSPPSTHTRAGPAQPALAPVAPPKTQPATAMPQTIPTSAPRTTIPEQT